MMGGEFVAWVLVIGVGLAVAWLQYLPDDDEGDE